MRRMILCLAWVACIAAAGEPKQGADPVAIARALESFSGTWTIASVVPEGATKDARQLVFRKDGTYAAVDAQGKELWGGTYEIDSTTAPKIWDHRSYEAKKEGKDVLGIYELDGDALKVACVVGQWKGKEWVGRPRPTSIKADAADVVIELKRVK